MDYIFLSGIHGVGKSTLATELKSSINIKSISVSDLIRQAGKTLDSSTKNTGNISKNQELWKNELNNLDLGISKLLLDGHFCLLDADNNITPLPFTTFEDTGMTKIIFMKNKPDVIKDRLLKRDKKDYSIELLKKLQDCELQQAMKYSTENEISLYIYDESRPLSELLDFITN
ncbi:ATP-binding protein [Priestia megaterium]|uniref:ATP-binding protein n=1 Tax=Priestia megaterium TaxID=1404 RepID=UPI0020795EEF|nr:ATP-binding protein [Priestia megaterium]USL25103.1 AAA family ATPase [Priestia megaterium]